MDALCSVSSTGDVPPDKALSETKNPAIPHHMSKIAPSWIHEKITRRKMEVMDSHNNFQTVNEYEEQRRSLLAEEKTESFDGQAVLTASAQERRANDIVIEIRQRDAELFYNSGRDIAGQVMTPEIHFVGNASNIESTQLFKIAQRMPKGAHLHCHFNSCLPPRFLLQQAKNNAHMYIKSNLALASEDNRERAEIQFQMHVLEEEMHLEASVSLLDNSYQATFDAKDKRRGWYSYDKFLQEYPGGALAAEDWLNSKLLFTEEEVHGVSQTAKNIWLRFGTRTRMLKGLFGHEDAFRAYTEACIQDFIRDNIQYAEIRPNFPSNSLVRSDATGFIDNVGLLQIIADAVEKQRGSGVYFGGLKVIYCCPRSFPNEKVEASLNECIELKKKFPDLICGYDLVGGEEAGYPIRRFVKELLAFRATCNEQMLDIPFLFHAGETLDTGSSVDENLLDAILLNSKRIGHGFALPKHPVAMRMVKERDIALEICPISNEILHLCPTIRGHTLPILLANNVHCTVNSDNGTFYGSTLSHDFYQVMVGSESMSLHGWRVLAEWSLEHSCMMPGEKAKVKDVWLKEWNNYCQWIIDTYGGKI